jgi:hypothetical protein
VSARTVPRPWFDWRPTAPPAQPPAAAAPGPPPPWRFAAALAEAVRSLPLPLSFSLSFPLSLCTGSYLLAPDQVRSGVRHVLAPDVAGGAGDVRLGESVLVPVVVLRDHAGFDPLQPGHPFSIDTAALQREIARLALPDQPVKVPPQPARRRQRRRRLGSRRFYACRQRDHRPSGR